MNNSEKLYYLSKFKNHVFVLKIGGELINAKSKLESLLVDIKELVDFGIKVVLVHGGGVQADDLARQHGHEPLKINGRRVTTQKDLEIVKMLYGGSLNLEILSLMKKISLKGIRVSGLDCDLLEAKKREVIDVDYGHVGDIEAVNEQIILDLVEKSYLPVVSPLAVTSEGAILNVNADTIATKLAIALKAVKLIFFTSTDGVLREGKLLNSLTTVEAQKLIDDDVATNGMAVKLSNCIKAVNGAVNRVHILNGLTEHSLLSEILTQKGVGTMVANSKEITNYFNETKRCN